MSFSSLLAALPRWSWPLLILTLVANLAAWLSLGALPDEAYYWVWSERLQAGYYDHPPLVAWLIRPFTALFGDTAFAFRLPAVLGWLVGVVLGYDLARRLFGDRRAGVLAALIWASLPIVQVGFHIVTPDIPMVLFTWVAFWFAVRAVQEARGDLWLWAGAAAGLALLGKYPAVLVPAAILAALPFSAEGRRALATRWPWLGGLVALLVFMPVVWWNASHDWISFAFQLKHGVRAQVQDPLPMLGQFIAGQMAVAMPWTWLAMVAAALPWALPPGGRGGWWLLAGGFWLPLLVFGAAGLTSAGHPNWPVAAYVPGTVLLAGALARWLWPPGGPRRWLAGLAVAGFVFSVLLVNLLRFPHWLMATGIELPPQRTQFSQAFGWDEVAPVLDRLLAAQPPGCRVVGSKLQTASMLALMLGGPERVQVSSETRLNQFHLWQDEEPVPASELCLYLEQYDSREDVLESMQLAGQGEWRLVRLLEHRNPDLSERWTAFYLRPES